MYYFKVRHIVIQDLSKINKFIYFFNVTVTPKTMDGINPNKLRMKINTSSPSIPKSTWQLIQSIWKSQIRVSHSNGSRLPQPSPTWMETSYNSRCQNLFSAYFVKQLQQKMIKAGRTPHYLGIIWLRVGLLVEPSRAQLVGYESTLYSAHFLYFLNFLFLSIYYFHYFFNFISSKKIS